jgi:hypothetical protein
MNDSFKLGRVLQWLKTNLDEYQVNDFQREFFELHEEIWGHDNPESSTILGHDLSSELTDRFNNFRLHVDSKIQLIKDVRQETSMGLKEAKDLVDKYLDTK